MSNNAAFNLGIPQWDVEIPPEGRLDFRIAKGWSPTIDNVRYKERLEIDLYQKWDIPRDGKTYYLLGTLHRETSGHGSHSMQGPEWLGTTEIQKVALP